MVSPKSVHFRTPQRARETCKTGARHSPGPAGLFQHYTVHDLGFHRWAGPRGNPSPGPVIGHAKIRTLRTPRCARETSKLGPAVWPEPDSQSGLLLRRELQCRSLSALRGTRPRILDVGWTNEEILLRDRRSAYQNPYTSVHFPHTPTRARRSGKGQESARCMGLGPANSGKAGSGLGSAAEAATQASRCSSGRGSTSRRRHGGARFGCRKGQAAGASSCVAMCLQRDICASRPLAMLAAQEW